ncbi:MAG TPA: hypothetical protein PLM79_10280 [Syntrophobacteraceae bacterium]|nr:hypothetical protein [Syntrophobacteraceae bacterium]
MNTMKKIGTGMLMVLILGGMLSSSFALDKGGGWEDQAKSYERDRGFIVGD